MGKFVVNVSVVQTFEVTSSGSLIVEATSLEEAKAKVVADMKTRPYTNVIDKLNFDSSKLVDRDYDIKAEEYKGDDCDCALPSDEEVA